MDANEIIIPTYEEFSEKLYSIFPRGNPDVIYAIMKDHIGKPLPDKSILTFDKLVQRYDEYAKYVKPFNDIKDKQFIKKEMMQREIGAYMMQKMYLNDYGAIVTDPNDNYLFGL